MQAQGIGYFGCNFFFGDMPHAQVMRSMKLFSEAIFRSYFPKLFSEAIFQ
ncbi:MAG TPA: hypothetical protein VFR55_02030 [Dehalococcoidia bacterium]|nr:hypothetical protein [Dehalococcoidia bacterium]